MNQVHFLPAILLILLLTGPGCQTPGETAGKAEMPGEVNPPDMHTSRDALDWAGSYMGKLPCADCQAIETVLTLRASGRYRKTSLYEGRSDEIFEESGTFVWSDDGSRITLHPDEGSDQLQQYQVGENQLFHLDEEGRRIEGELAQRYILRRINTPLEGEKWILSRIGETAVAAKEGVEMPYILLRDGRVQAWAGCNRMLAGYQHHPGQMLRIEAMMSTKMACEDMTLETQLAGVLEQTQRYMISDRTLMLYAAPSEMLAVFRAE